MIVPKITQGYLESLVTWDLPQPVDAELVNKAPYDLESLGNAGLLLFVPWYLLFDKEFDLHKLAAHRLLTIPSWHIKHWFAKDPKKLGYERFGHMLQLYVYWELAFKSRYGKRLFGLTKQLDRAFGQFIYQTPKEGDRGITVEDSMKKLRQELSRRLQQTVDD
jgi:hypothetical protein